MTLFEEITAYRAYNAQEAADRALMQRYMQQYSDLFYRENPTMHFTASGWVVSPRREQVLMVYHNIYQSWSWSGGHADGAETLLAVAVREVLEETGLSEIRVVSPSIFSLEILGVNGHRKEGRHISTHLHLNVTYLLEADPSLPLRVKQDENSAVAWIPAEQVIERSSEPDMRIIYQKLMEKLPDFLYDAKSNGGI